jgi:hypothetical protein
VPPREPGWESGPVLAQGQEPGPEQPQEPTEPDCKAPLERGPVLPEPELGCSVRDSRTRAPEPAREPVPELERALDTSALARVPDTRGWGRKAKAQAMELASERALAASEAARETPEAQSEPPQPGELEPRQGTRRWSVEFACLKLLGVTGRMLDAVCDRRNRLVIGRRSPLVILVTDFRSPQQLNSGAGRGSKCPAA